ncbi:unnamed protein product, partial [Polarella glacialis]
DFPLFRLRCSAMISKLSCAAEALAQTCLRIVSQTIEERADAILEEWETTYKYIMSSPEDEGQMAELREFMTVVQKKVVLPLMVRTRTVHNTLNMVEDFYHD